ncbi:sialidase family protein [Jiangella alkaliphila]|uniref:exo-alpha-sialidase n=1 Tax=Jiangella alkaliphila TaxID=419479 RepID=A0A1H2LJS2_9ACTN|nr:sialidase family protein [Jiangella alkaliphila]SDU81169.1 BNR repeat-like domain-containing protein [Jiangella alkaliphila]
MTSSRRMFLGGAAGVAALGLTGAGVASPQRAFALGPLVMESKMLFGDAQAGPAAVPKPSGNGNYHSCRIPSIFAVPGSSVVMAVVEGRPDEVSDASGNFNLLMRRSTDAGLTWSAATSLAAATLYSWANPTMVHDRTTGRLYCFMLRRQPGDLHDKDPKVYLATSDDNGATWTDPVVRNDLNRRLPSGGTTNDFIGPGNGIQRSGGALVVPAKGRLIIKELGGDWANHDVPDGLYEVENGNRLPYGEGTVAERSDGQLILNYRALNAELNNGFPAARRIAIGNPGSWRLFGDEHWRTQIIDPGSHAALISHSINGNPFLVHLNSNSPERDDRYAMTLRASADDGETWSTYQRPLSHAPLANEGDLAGDLREGGYSALASTGSGIILALVEARRLQYDNPSLYDVNHNSPCAVALRRFDPNWIVPA